jgi:hypothetical protein
MRNAYKISVGKPGETRQFAIPRHVNGDIYCNELGCEDVFLGMRSSGDSFGSPI